MPIVMPPPQEPLLLCPLPASAACVHADLSVSWETQLFCAKPAPHREPTCEAVSNAEPLPPQLLKAGTSWVVRLSK
jgi:hypothetical protein